MKAKGIWRSLRAFLATEAGAEIWQEIRAAIVGGQTPPVSPTTPPAGGIPPEELPADRGAVPQPTRAERRAAATKPHEGR